MLGGYIGEVCQRILNGIVRQIARLDPNPNLLSVIGLGISVFAALLYGTGRFFSAGLVMIFANIFDMVVFLGIIIFYARDSEYHSTLYVALTGAALIGSVMVSYTSARAESLIPKCDVGFLRRPERVVLLIIGSITVWPESNHPLLNKMPATIWLMAVLSYWTFCHRLYHTRRAIREMESAPDLSPIGAQENKSQEKKEAKNLRLGHDPV